PALAPLAAIAVLHHERLDGSGYPRGVAGPALPAEGRLLAAADFYLAKTEPRPHRAAADAAGAAAAVWAEVRAGRLVDRAEHPALHRLERIRRPRGAHGARHERAVVTGQQRVELRARVAGAHLGVGRDQRGHLRVAQAARVDGEPAGQADL